jgi:hypothetical protein
MVPVLIGISQKNIGHMIWKRFSPLLGILLLELPGIKKEFEIRKHQ